ncbi:MAG TPA: thiol:disulfide interchange protein DsbA/DsbL [Steroidobacteraceae bacterium]|nr:thiol:disulfide interchange protein DsbA/DsbL [Steroidobacteraceae bacterium]
MQHLQPWRTVHCLGVLLLTVGLAACARNPGPAAAAAADSAAATASPAAQAAGATAAPAAAAPVSASALTAAATTEQETADTDTTDRSQLALERVAALPARDQLPRGKWIAGTNYSVLSPAQPTQAAPGHVEVIEVFWYGCPHCYALDPYLQNWLQSKPPYIDFVRVPVMWNDIHRAHARLFYTLQALGKLGQLHGKVFDEIQQRGDQLYVPNDPRATLAEQLKFAAANGISASDFTNAYNSFGVQADLQKADGLDRRYRIDSVPTIIIDGKYESDVGQAGGDAQLIELINDLAASEKRLIG